MSLEDFGHPRKKLCGLPTPWEQGIPSRILLSQLPPLKAAHRTGKAVPSDTSLSDSPEMGLDQGKMGKISCFSNYRNPGSQLWSQNAAVVLPKTSRLLGGVSPFPGTHQPPHSIQIFQFLSVISGCVPNPLNHIASEKDIQGQAVPLMENSSNATLLGKKILNKIPAPPKSSPQPRIHRDLSCSHPTGTAFVSLVWRSLKPRTLSQDCLQEMII